MAFCSLIRTFVPVMTPLISFIITYHNEPESFLKACVESIQALPLEMDEAEIIVVDDGSETPCSMFDGGYTVFRQEQAGLSVARNTGISHALGRYIQFVDADDCLIPSVYGAVIEQMRKEELDVVMFRMTKQPPHASPCKIPFKSSLKEDSFSSSFKGGRVGSGVSFLQHCNLRAAVCAYAFRREILGDLRFQPGLIHEDELFTPQLFLRAESICELDIAAYFYRQHSGTITHSATQEQVQKRLNDIRFAINELKKLNKPILERRIRQLTVDYLQKTWTLTRSFQELRRRISELRADGLLPLPLRRYSLRYLFVALTANLL